jgi:hypothetical protein
VSTGTTPVTLPPGCFGIQMESTGQEFNARPGGTVYVPDEYGSELSQSNAAQNGMITVGLRANLGTRRGRLCTRENCHFIAQVWSDECPRCGHPTGEARYF